MVWQVTFEKERIKEENAYIASAVAKAEVDVELFLQGKPCSLEIDKGLGPRLVESMAVNVMERDADEREKTRATRRAQLEAAGKTKGGNVSFLCRQETKCNSLLTRLCPQADWSPSLRVRREE